MGDHESGRDLAKIFSEIFFLTQRKIENKP
jgi:hypothetical protein